MKSGLVKCMWEPLDFPRFSRRLLVALCTLKHILHLRLKGSEAYSSLWNLSSIFKHIFLCIRIILIYVVAAAAAAAVVVVVVVSWPGKGSIDVRRPEHIDQCNNLLDTNLHFSIRMQLKLWEVEPFLFHFFK